MSYKPFDLTGKTAIVTGGNTGIGLGMAEALAQAGASLSIWGRNEEKNLAAQKQLQAHGVKVIAQKIDVSDEGAVVAGMEAAMQELGHIDTVVANAGASGGGSKSMLETSAEVYRKVMSTNLDGVWYTLREGARHMIAQGTGGSLIAVSSMAAVEGTARSEHYAAAKAGVLAIARGMAVEFARYGIRANSILPGWIATDMTTRIQGDTKFNEKVITRVPLRRWGKPEDFGGIVVYLASDAAAFHTGTDILIDGGYTIF
jgi:NAD(P)-dependent dehydrogenase (short-subunit alcohol dehydrogenase family)